VPLNPAPTRRPRLALPWARLYVVAAVASKWLRCCLSPPDCSLGRNVFTRGSDAAQSPTDRSADFGRLEGGRDMTFRLSNSALPYSGSSGGQGFRKGQLDGCLLPITLPVTVGLGENVTGASNALVAVPASGGGRRPCARGLLICTSQFRIRRLPFSRDIADSHDHFSALEAMVVVTLWQSHVGTGGVESGASIYMRVLSLCALARVPL